MSKKDLLHKLFSNQHLTAEEAEHLMLFITEGSLSEIEISAILMFYKTHPVSINELASFRKILLGKCVKFSIPFSAIDVCGTGGDEKDTFNISTLSAVVIAAAGYKVVKHGNYGVSSVSGSSNILEYFGYKFTNNETDLREQLDQHNICFLHAPLFHPALKHVAPVRKALGTKTIFNLLGPLVNPCNVSHQFIGVNSLETARNYNYLLQNAGVNYVLAHSLDGYDEISLTGEFKLMGNNSESLLHPGDIHMPVLDPKQLNAGDTIEQAAKIFLSVLNNEASTAQKHVVITNAAFAIQLMTQKTIKKCIAEATEAIETKKALNIFKNLTQGKHEYA
jgi:anthranilate phosphoribosyltransferase